MIRRLLLPVVALALAGSGLVASAGPAAASVKLRPETISAGGSHTCALDTAGKAWCWGWDDWGQIGDGEASQGANYSPVKVAGDQLFTTISAGGRHTCALDTAGKAWCWGMDEWGSVGDGPAPIDRYSPVRVAGDRVYTTISAGGLHTCALDRAGKGWCWGSGADGQVGQGDGGADTTSPVQVTGNLVFTTISAGLLYHTCALDAAGRAWCWGNAQRGQLGDGDASQEFKYSPVQVAGGRVFKAISAGGVHTCALGVTGKAWCWGADFYGQLGDGGLASGDVSSTGTYSPVKVAGNRVFTTINAGIFHTCALGTAGRAWCWGDVSGQQLDGEGGYADSQTAPMRVAGNRIFKAISAGGSHTCALGPAGKAWCWGDDTYGQVGDGDASQEFKHSPVRVARGRVAQ